MTNSSNNTPSNHDDCEHGENVPLRRSPPTLDAQALLDEELQFDVWLEESWALAAQEDDWAESHDQT